MEVNQGKMEIKMDYAIHERMVAAMKSSQEKNWAKMNAFQDDMSATIQSIQSKLKEIINKLILGILVSIDQWTRSLCQELSSKIEKGSPGGTQH